ncbi:thymosin beta-like isoform X3 [Dermacentor silvarum]|uniref:thymosin beta-like isoform X3 n=1 Tax=Dermacentor silvarum TaxID=543639 RepID=UPI002100A663|nr:thymosin beta-like isoform X3 [Dermacentor silvarum]
MHKRRRKCASPKKKCPKMDNNRQALLGGIKGFEKSRLKHTVTKVKQFKPTAQDIESEKEHKQMIEGIETFDPSKLKHAETSVKNPLPTKEVIEQEKAA